MLHFNSLSHTTIIESPWREFYSIIPSYILESIFKIIYFQSYDLRHKLSKIMVLCRQKTYMWPSRRCVNQNHKIIEWSQQYFYESANISLNSFKEFEWFHINLDRWWSQDYFLSCTCCAQKSEDLGNLAKFKLWPELLSITFLIIPTSGCPRRSC
jgi:hypothetical protein